jgi:hypothetical protein
LVPQVGVQVLFEVVGRVREAAQETAVVRQRLDAFVIDLAEQADRVAVAGPPQLGVDGLEEIQRFRVPRPAKIEDEFPEGGKLPGKLRADCESS